MALVFPSNPNLNDVFPLNPGTSGISQWKWDGTKWNSVLTTISLGNTNQGAFNAYNWPATDGTAGKQLTTDGNGNLTWSQESDSNIEALGVTPLFDGTSKVYTLVKLGTMVFFEPTPSTNIVVFLGGAPQVPTVSYTISGNQIEFTDPPPVGTTFYAISNVVI